MVNLKELQKRLDETLKQKERVKKRAEESEYQLSLAKLDLERIEDNIISEISLLKLKGNLKGCGINLTS